MTMKKLPFRNRFCCWHARFAYAVQAADAQRAGNRYRRELD